MEFEYLLATLALTLTGSVIPGKPIGNTLNSGAGGVPCLLLLVIAKYKCGHAVSKQRYRQDDPEKTMIWVCYLTHLTLAFQPQYYDSIV